MCVCLICSLIYIVKERRAFETCSSLIDSATPNAKRPTTQWLAKIIKLLRTSHSRQKLTLATDRSAKKIPVISNNLLSIRSGVRVYLHEERLIAFWLPTAGAECICIRQWSVANWVHSNQRWQFYQWARIAANEADWLMRRKCTHTHPHAQSLTTCVCCCCIGSINVIMLCLLHKTHYDVYNNAQHTHTHTQQL